MPPEQSLWLQIGTDPTPWVLADTDYGSLPAQLEHATSPIVLAVVSPLQGQLVLSPRAAGSFSLLGSPSVGGPHPVGDPLSVGGPHPVGDAPAAQTTPVVYLPSVIAGNPGSPVNVLEPGSDLAAVAQNIIDAMNNGTVLTLQVVERDIIDATDVTNAIKSGTPISSEISARSGSGVLVLNGATLAFAVLAQVATQAGQSGPHPA